MRDPIATQEKTEYTDEEINELAEWFEELTLKQAFFLKDSFAGYMTAKAQEHGQEHAH